MDAFTVGTSAVGGAARLGGITPADATTKPGLPGMFTPQLVAGAWF